MGLLYWCNLVVTLAPKMDSFRVQLCGRLVIEDDGARIETQLPGRQGRLLFGYLVINDDRALPREELIAAAWGDDATPDGDVLSPLLSKLRKVVGADRIQGRSDVRFVGGEGLFVDARAAQESLHRAEYEVDQQNWTGAWTPAHNAYHIAKRRFMLGLEAPWIDEWRRRLEEICVRGLYLFARAGLGLGGTALPHSESAARTMLEMAPFNETGYRVLMEVLESQGNRAGALVIYERLRQLLREELGTDPSPELQEVHGRLLR
jgi:DNA-binding SARP family transcriptional activator